MTTAYNHVPELRSHHGQISPFYSWSLIWDQQADSHKLIDSTDLHSHTAKGKEAHCHLNVNGADWAVFKATSLIYLNWTVGCKQQHCTPRVAHLEQGSSCPWKKHQHLLWVHCMSEGWWWPEHGLACLSDRVTSTSETIGGIHALLPTLEGAGAVPPPGPTIALVISPKGFPHGSEVHPPGSLTCFCPCPLPCSAAWRLSLRGTDLPHQGAAACTLCKTMRLTGMTVPETNWRSGAASVTHGDPQAFPPSAGKLRCSLPKDTSMGGFVFFRAFFFTIHTHPRVHSTEILMITLSYCCFVGLTALKT